MARARQNLRKRMNRIHRRMAQGNVPYAERVQLRAECERLCQRRQGSS